MYWKNHPDRTTCFRDSESLIVIRKTVGRLPLFPGEAVFFPICLKAASTSSTGVSRSSKIAKTEAAPADEE